MKPFHKKCLFSTQIIIHHGNPNNHENPNNSGGGGFIIQSPTQPVNPIEVFPVASPGTHHLQHHLQHHSHCHHHCCHCQISAGDPYTCLVSRIQGMTLGQQPSYHGGPPSTQVFVIIFFAVIRMIFEIIGKLIEDHLNFKLS